LDDGQPDDALGHPLYRQVDQGGGRIDNPDEYLVLYCSLTATGAVGESFAHSQVWNAGTFAPKPSMPSSMRSMATIRVPEKPLLDVDHGRTLLERSLKPSWIVTTNRKVTQSWALEIYREASWHGIQWWSRHNADWPVLGMWDLDGLEVLDIEPLTLFTPAVVESANQLARRIDV